MRNKGITTLNYNISKLSSPENITPIFRPFPVKFFHPFIPQILQNINQTTKNPQLPFTTTIIPSNNSDSLSLLNHTPSISIIQNFPNYPSSPIKPPKPKINIKKLNSPYRKLLRPKSKKLDKSLMTINLNQIEIFKHHLKFFPLIQLSEEESCVTLFTRMLINGNYFNIINKQHLPQNTKKINEDAELNIKFTEKITHDINYDNSLLSLLKTTNKISDIIKKLYNEIKQSVLEIHKNFVGKKKKVLNEVLQRKLFQLINFCNDIADEYINIEANNEQSEILLSSPQKKFTYFNLEQDTLKSYKCLFCERVFENGQGLGGHISRHHPNQSEKYKMKLQIRNQRKEKRENLKLIRKGLFKKYGLDYEKIVNDKQKTVIKKFLKEHKVEYFLMKKRANQKG